MGWLELQGAEDVPQFAKEASRATFTQAAIWRLDQGDSGYAPWGFLQAPKELSLLGEALE